MSEIRINKTEQWNVNPPHQLRNFICSLNNKGLWREEEKRIGEATTGKWIFCIDKIGFKNAPTFPDQKNFMTGLFEAEWRNDNFVFKDGTTRNPQRMKKIKMFKDLIEDIENRADIKDTPHGLDFYLNTYKETK